MKRKFIIILSAGCLLLVGTGLGSPAYAATTGVACPLTTGPKDRGSMENKVCPPTSLEKGGKALQSVWKKLQIAGGISAGTFYATNPGQDTSGNEALLSNYLFEISECGNDLPISFAVAFGESSTPSLLSTPDGTSDPDLEYASLSVNALAHTSIEMGLLKPDAGYEDTYTYNNSNIVLGALASQQPYNAYGVKLRYSPNNLNLNAAYYGKRLDESEYGVNELSLSHAWEVGIGSTIKGVSYRLYHYHMAGIRNLTGAVLEHTYENIYFALNVDWWQWNKAMANYYDRRSSVGGAFYAAPCFGKFSLPVRLEYIDQGGSRIYLDNSETKRIYAATISPTYHFKPKAYIRLESSYVYASKGFADKEGRTKDKRVYLAAEIGYLF